MFTGIIEALGRVADIKRHDDMRLLVHTGTLDLHDVKLGDSIAVNGVCLTATELTGTGFWADVSRETLAHSTLGALQNGDPLNLEKALTPSTRLGGHLVSGHVDGIGHITDLRDDGRSTRLQIQAPAALMRYIAAKGSICIDGISLTVNSVDEHHFELNIVPHTLEQTLIKYYSCGRAVNLEVDLIARYLERLLLSPATPDQGSEPTLGAHHKNNDHNTGKNSAIDLDFLGRHGFLR